MGKVYGGIDGLSIPEFKPGQDWDEHERDCDRYVEAVKAWARENGTGDYAGEEIRFPVADGYARYIVLGLKPVELVLLQIHDAYMFEYANRLTAKDVRQRVDRQKRIEELFRKQRA